MEVNLTVCEQDQGSRQNEGTLRVGEREVQAMIDDSWNMPRNHWSCLGISFASYSHKISES